MLSKTIEINGLNIFYREGGDPSRPKLVLLHGFPASSHQYRNLIPALADHFHIVAPDYPGFGSSDMPIPTSFAYTFDNLAVVTEAFLQKIGFTASVCMCRTMAAPWASVSSASTRNGWNG